MAPKGSKRTCVPVTASGTLKDPPGDHNGSLSGRRGDGKPVEESDTQSTSDEEGSLDVAACCLCHSSMDFTDRAAFFRPDRMEDYNEDTDNEDDYVFRPSDPYMPVELYDDNNALLYCDGCSRLYHQKCHFVPVTVVPRGEWKCMLCHHFNRTHKKKKQSSAKSALSSGPQKTTASSTVAANRKLYGQMRKAYQDETLFASPPVPAVRPLEQAWEYESRHLKATHFQSQVIKRVKQYVESQGSTYRLAETAVITLTSTTKNRNHFFKTSSASQELAQNLVKLYGVRKNWRQACWMLHDLQRSTHTAWDTLQQFCDTVTKDFVTKVLFPFGRHYPRRVEPRTAEAQLSWNAAPAQANHDPPSEIIVGTTVRNPPQQGKKKSKANNENGVTSPKRTGKKGTTPPKKKDDDDSGISLDDLQCCNCRTSEATDENDLILCDGEGCFRAFHAHCVSPALKESDLDEHVDWFCPYCTAQADTFLAIQTIHMGDEWEQERYMAMIDQNGNASLASSLQSWSDIREVFPTAEQDYAAACQLRDGKRNKATDDLLARVLGLDALPDHDDDDEVEDGNFDLESYQKERNELRQQQRGRSEGGESDAADEEEVDDESSHSSQATLVEMSSVELVVGKAELDALSRASSDSDESDEEDDSVGENGVTRRSRRLRKTEETNTGKDLVEDIGEFDEANIMEGKRGRKPVDYIQLNHAMFGTETDKDSSTLDDTEEFKETSRKKSDESSDSESDSNSSDEDDSDEDSSDEEGSDDSSEESSEESEEKKVEAKSRKRQPVKTQPKPKVQTSRKRKAGENGIKHANGTKQPRLNGVNVSEKCSPKLSGRRNGKVAMKGTPSKPSARTNGTTPRKSPRASRK